MIRWRRLTAALVELEAPFRRLVNDSEWAHASVERLALDDGSTAPISATAVKIAALHRRRCRSQALTALIAVNSTMWAGADAALMFLIAAGKGLRA